MVKTKPVKNIKELIKEGKENGFLTQDDLLAIFPKPELHLKEIDEL